MSDISLTKRALAAIDDLQRKLKALEDARREPIAIVGMSCRLPPDINGPEDYWRGLLAGIDAISEVPADRWPVDGVYDPDPSAAGRMVTRRGGFLRDIAGFDAVFFGISPAEARAMDPQQRLLLEVVWEALADAGLTEERLAGSAAGLFVGAASSDYRDLAYAERARIDPYYATGTSNSVLAGRIAYLLDLRGPAITVDTACSSSLVAVHMACQSLRSGECDMAVAAGVHVMISPEPLIASSKMGLLSADGLCRSFDAAAAGVGIGEGCGAVVLKRIGDALRDRDRITAVIRGSAINQDGRSNGLTAPNGVAQVALIERALEMSGLRGDSIGYVETHGTGTPLGDPIEAEALEMALGRHGRPCWLGAVKTNFGHLTAAAGIAGLQKAALVLERATIPPNLHFRQLNSQIDFPAGGRFAVPIKAMAWPDSMETRRAGVSSFGWSGTNCHVVLEQAPPLPPAKPSLPAHHVLLVSARDPDTLEVMIDRYRDFLAVGGEGEGLLLEDICFTAAVRRTHYRYRRAAVGGSHGEIAAALAGRQAPGCPEAMRVPIEAYLAGEAPDLDRLVARKSRCVRLVRHAWNHRPYWLPRPPQSAVMDDGPKRPRGALREKLADEPHFRRREILSDFVCGEVAAVLGLEAGRQVDPEEGFFQLGMTSLGAVALHRRLETACDQRWPTTTVFENRRVVELVNFLQTAALKELFETEDSTARLKDDVVVQLRQTLDRLGATKPK
jgi:acyl transferase domain-containing protein